ncbi:MAG: hypothetical protein J0L82_12110 [Deltaproteobacteria bacterium]|nr:hypothetical protein [Deltaproteobacteria bacterium]
MINKLDEIIRKVAIRLAANNRNVRPGFSPTTAAIGLPAVLAFFMLLISVVPQFVREASHVNSRPFEQNIHAEDWYVSYEDREESLWKNKIVRDMYAHSQELDRRPGEVYWIGIQIPAAYAEKARRAGADHLFVGYLIGESEIYIDSKLVKSGPGNGYRRATVVVVPEKSFQDPSGFRVAIRIRNDAREMYPDTLFYTGLATSAQVETHVRWQEFRSMISNSIAFGLNLALGFFFFALWLCGVKKQELSAFAAFGLMNAVTQSLTMPMILDYLGPMSSYRLNFIIKVYEVLFVLWLGASLARIRPPWVLRLLTAGLVLPWLIFETNWSPNEIFHGTYFMSMWVCPYVYFVAAFLCLAQARLVSTSHMRDLVDPARLLKLHFSWMALVLMGAVQIYGVQNYFDARILNAVLLMGLAAAVVHDYRRQELFVRRAPLSKYHQLAVLPERVPCVLATIDLKRSESLYRLGSAQGVGGAYVVDIISQFYRLITESGGEVIQTEGDSITFFFDQAEAKGSDVSAMLKALISIRGLDQKLRDHLSTQSESGHLPKDIRLRAALDVGAIRPVWQRFEGRDVPSWEQAAESNVFVDVARLLEAEAKVGDKAESSLIFKGERAEEISAQMEKRFPGVRYASFAAVEIKHGRKLDVTISSLNGFGFQIASEAS